MDKVIRLINMDFPDPDVIRVGDVYYMISTTMHFCPGAQILSSKDLLYWKHESYVYDYLEETDARRLLTNEHIYGKGMWAASLRYHRGVFYVCFVANDTHKTYLYKSHSINGPWVMNEIKGFYHDCSLLFEDEKCYIVYGNKQIYITELNEQLTGPKEFGLHKMIIEDTANVRLGYEGSHLYKINNKYYLFFIHWPNTGTARRTQSCFVADSLDGEWHGKNIYDWDGGFRNSGVAQGGIVDTPQGDYFAIMFQDCGAVGRIPVLVPIHFDDEWPVLCEQPEENYGNMIYQREGEELFGTGFMNPDVKDRLLPFWQWNHIPDDKLWFVDDDDVLVIQTDKISSTLTVAKNILTQRMLYPGCAAEVCIDASLLQDGDYAGLCSLQGSYAMIAIRKNTEDYELVMKRRRDNQEVWGFDKQDSPDEEIEVVKINQPVVSFRLEADFSKNDLCRCFYKKDNSWIMLGCEHPLVFRLDHFTGCRFGLFVYSTKKTGGKASFFDFKYQKP